MNFNSGKKAQSKVTGSIRMSQLITTFGPGSIVNLPDCSVMIKGTDFWKIKNEFVGDENLVREPNLQKLLKKKEFYHPPASEGDKLDPNVPATRFPRMYFCPSCGRLQNWKKFDHKKVAVRCPQCDKQVVPSRFLVACVNGHVDDFPFSWWVHHEKKCPNGNEKLKIKFSKASGGLESIIIECESCHAERSMAGCMSMDALKGYRCFGHKPWLHGHGENDDCKAPLRTLQRGASNLYFPVTASALTIPNNKGYLFQLFDSRKKKIDKYIEKKGLTGVEDMLELLFDDEMEKNNISMSNMLRVFQIWHGSEADDDFDEQDMRELEYNTLCKGTLEDKNYKAEEVAVPDLLKNYVERVILLRRLREVTALEGFRRIYPEYPDSDEYDRSKFMGWNEKQLISLSQEKMDWLPAIESLGEGIFIKLPAAKLHNWEKEMEVYYSPMRSRLAQTGRREDIQRFSPRYVLLHTMSHLLMRQLTFDCGYSGASIKERIYSTYTDSEQEMAGILLYTASSDADGSLGGLVRMGRPENLQDVFSSMLHQATWCSSDPLCADSKGQGFNSLNYAACHACSLVPETSCEMHNLLLDRCSLIGELDNRGRGYFSEMLNK